MVCHLKDLEGFVSDKSLDLPASLLRPEIFLAVNAFSCLDIHSSLMQRRLQQIFQDLDQGKKYIMHGVGKYCFATESIAYTSLSFVDLCVDLKGNNKLLLHAPCAFVLFSVCIYKLNASERCSIFPLVVSSVASCVSCALV